MKSGYLPLCIFVLLAFGCIQKAEHSSEIQSDSTERNPGKNPNNGTDEDIKQQIDTAASVKFIDYQHDGLIFPDEYKLYDDKIRVIGKLKIVNIQPIRIIQKSKDKHPQTTQAEHCLWANYLKVIHQGDTIVIFGRNAMNISSIKRNVILKSDTLNLILAEDFSMEVTDENGLTGCDDFSYVFINSKVGEYSLVFPSDSETRSGFDFAVLYHDDGVGEELKGIQVNSDTLILNVDAHYQEGSGSYKLKIFRSTGWTFVITDRVEREE